MVYSLDLDITPGGVPQIVKLSQYDKIIPEIQAILWNGPSGYTIPTGATVLVAGTKPDKTGFEYQCTYSGSTVTIDITEQMTAVAGRVSVEVIVETATGRKGSANFFLDVEPAALSDDTIISDTDIPIIQQIPEILAECEDYADLAHKWATFGNDSETPSSTNNALYWAQKSQEYAVGALHWKASVAFANIPTTGMEVGDMYNITDAFTTDARFDEGAGVKCSAGTNIVWDANGKWDILISSTNAADINFDNTGTGMTATNVQNAITELNTVKQASTDNNLTTTDKTVTGAINEINTSLSAKQNATDNSLTTTNKTIPGAINELNSNLTTDTPDYELSPSGRTWAQTMYALDNAIDKSKITRHSCIEWGGIYAHIEYKTSNYIGYAWNIVNVSAQKSRTIYCKMGVNQNEVVEVEGTTFSDLSSTVATDTVKFYY